jgi:hypothetical protein
VKKVLRVFLGLLVIGLLVVGVWAASTSGDLASVTGLRESISSDLATRDASYVPLEQGPTGAPL